MLFVSCAGSNIPDFYLVVNKTTVHKNHTFSSSHLEFLQAGDTIRVTGISGQFVKFNYYGEILYAELKDLKKLDIPEDERRISDTSSIPKDLQRKIYRLTDYRSWEFWTISGVLLFLFAGARFVSIFLLSFFASLLDKEVWKEEKYPVYGFGVGLIPALWLVILPDTSRDVLYTMFFIDFNADGSFTSYVIKLSAAVFIVSNMFMLYRRVMENGIFFPFTYTYLTLMGLLAYIFALFTASGSIAALILLGALFYFITAPGNLLDYDEAEESNDDDDDNEDYNDPEDVPPAPAKEKPIREEVMPFPEDFLHTNKKKSNELIERWENDNFRNN